MSSSYSLDVNIYENVFKAISAQDPRTLTSHGSASQACVHGVFNEKALAAGALQPDIWRD